MRRGTSYRLSGEILNLKCVSNLLSSINDPDQGLALENLKRSASYGCLCCKNPGSMHPVDIFMDPLTLAKFHQVLVYVCGMFMCLLVKTIPGIHCWTSLLLILKMIWYNVNLFFCLGLRIFPLQIMSLLYQPCLWMFIGFDIMLLPNRTQSHWSLIRYSSEDTAVHEFKARVLCPIAFGV